MENTQTLPSDTSVPAESTPPQNPQDNTNTQPALANKKHSISSIMVWIFAVLGILFMIGVAVYLVSPNTFRKNTPTEITKENTTPLKPTTPNSAPDTTSEITDESSGAQGVGPDFTGEPKVLSAINWLSPIQKVAAIAVFKEKAFVSEVKEGQLVLKNAEYFQVGSTKDGSLLYRVTIPYYNNAYSDKFYFLKSQSGKFTFLAENDSYKYDNFGEMLLPDVNIQYTTITALDMPEKVDLQQGTLVRTNSVATKLPDTSTTEGMPDTKYGKLVRDVTPAEDYDGLSNVVFYLTRKDGTYMSYQLNPEIVTDDNKLKMKPKTPKEYSDSFLSGLGSSCGGRGGTRIATHASDLEGAKKVGETYFGDLYQITDTSNTILKTLYKTYKSSHDYEGGPKILTIDEFAKQPNHVFWRDQFGDWEVFMSEQFVPPAECGKPVVYLYPQSPTDVQVQVGAKVTVSEPEYGDEWNGRAFPDGTIVVNGKTYPYLFWEGLGNGFYPNDISSRGTIVKQEEAESTIQEQLRAQGLNDKEISDFMEFWGSKIPTTPYVRLSWLGTHEMNELAPLTIAPKADTVIRVFLDMQGLESPRSITPQQFHAPKRTGFTAVEWGGLLLGSMR